MPLECERKYIGVDFVAVRAFLQANNARSEGAHMESNSLWDTAERSLRPKGMLLRLRTQQWFKGNSPECVAEKHILTLKAAANEQQGCKIREESEVLVDDVHTMEAILSGLGYSTTAHYEKLREVWHLHNTELALDILPFGNFMEVEGTVDDIEHVARLVHIDSAPQSTASYHRLHQEWRTQQGLPTALDIVFEPAKKAALLRYLQELHL